MRLVILQVAASPVHPRACGEHAIELVLGRPLGGSSPRLRGRVYQVLENTKGSMSRVHAFLTKLLVAPSFAWIGVYFILPLGWSSMVSRNGSNDRWYIIRNARE